MLRAVSHPLGQASSLSFCWATHFPWMSLAYSATRLQALHVLLADWLTGVALLAFSVLVFLCFTPVLTFVNSAIVEERQVRLASTRMQQRTRI